MTPVTVCNGMIAVSLRDQSLPHMDKVAVTSLHSFLMRHCLTNEVSKHVCEDAHGSVAGKVICNDW